MITVAFALSGLVCGTAQAATAGTLTQLASPNGCITDASTPLAGCGTARALLGPGPFFGSYAVALSPDGKNLYAVSFNSEGVAVFDRSRTSGRLTQKSGSAGCTTMSASAGCASGHGLVKPASIAVSFDGKSVYVASVVGSSVAVFDRNTSTGTLKQKSGTAGCIANDARPDCAHGRALGGADVVAVSPDDRNVYVGSFTSNGVVSFERNRSTGALTQKPGPDGCIVETPVSDCRIGRALKGAEGLTVSPDGKSVYVGAAIGNAVAVFERNRATGRLDQPAARAGCVVFAGDPSCASGDGLVGAEALVVSPDNKNLYVAAGIGDSVAVFGRSTRTGQITQVAGIAGCYTNRAHDLGRCTSGVALDGPEGIAVSPDGNSVYVGSFNSSAITVFDRVSFNGTITQRSGANGCIVNVATSGCTTGMALDSTNALAVSPDGLNVYAGSYGSNALDVFSRAQPADGHVAVSVPSRVTVAPRSVISVPVSCRGSHRRRCPGGLELQASRQSLTAGAASLGTIGRASFNVSGGKSANVSVALAPSASRYLKANGSLTTVATLRVVEPTGRIRSFRQTVVLSQVVGRE